MVVSVAGVMHVAVHTLNTAATNPYSVLRANFPIQITIIVPGQHFIGNYTESVIYIT